MDSTVDIPTHPTSEALAEAELDADEFIAEMRAKGSMSEIDRMLGSANATDRFYRELMFPLLRQMYAYGISSERGRCAGWLVALGVRAKDNGSPVRAKALVDLAMDLLGGVEAPPCKSGAGSMAEAIRDELQARRGG